MNKLWRDWMDCARLVADLQSVAALRMMRMAVGGPRAAAESRLMVSEKVSALAESQAAAGMALASGRGLEVAVRQAAAPIKRKVRANRRRLTRKRP
jgi:hypothetical protein